MAKTVVGDSQHVINFGFSHLLELNIQDNSKLAELINIQ